ncbi:MAG TPA: hypothetical protein VFD00_10000 [Thermoclostridium sp.]|nr:hypothetical protein [Thermoclostridium sp.]
MDTITNFFGSFVLGQDYINGLVLIGLICVNIFLGSMDAWINNTWDKSKLINGIKKGFSISVATLATYLLGGFIPDVLVMTVNEVEVTLVTAISVAITAGLIWYGKEVVIKIKNAIGGKTV